MIAELFDQFNKGIVTFFTNEYVIIIIVGSFIYCLYLNFFEDGSIHKNKTATDKKLINQEQQNKLTQMAFDYPEVVEHIDNLFSVSIAEYDKAVNKYNLILDSIKNN